MAFRGALTHRKTRRLAKCLSIPACFALGIMEAIWHVTAEQTPAGDIGKLSNQDIADEIFYDGDADELINALVESGLVDESEEYRLVIHDWSTRADQTVHVWMAKRTLLFCDGSMPTLNDKSLSGQTQCRLKSEYEAKYGLRLTPVRHLSDTCQTPVINSQTPVRHNLTNLDISLTNPEPEPEPDSINTKQEIKTKQEIIPYLSDAEKPSESSKPADATDDGKLSARQRRLEHFEEIWTAFVSKYPSRPDLSKAKGKIALRAVIADNKASPSVILAGVERYAAYCDREGITGTSKVAMIPTWVHQERWNEPYMVAKPPPIEKPKPRPGFSNGLDPRCLR